MAVALNCGAAEGGGAEEVKRRETKNETRVWITARNAIQSLNNKTYDNERRKDP
jgi:hypothetical protein